MIKDIVLGICLSIVYIYAIYSFDKWLEEKFKDK